VDSLAPIIQGFWLESSSLDPSQPGGAYLSAAIRFSDDLSGLSAFSYDSIRISFRSSSSGQTRSLYLSTYDLQGSTLAGTFYASGKLDPFISAGSWSLDSIQLRDQAGNSFYKSSSSSDWTTFLSSSGITQTSFQIAYGSNPAPGTGPDSLAPSIEGFSLDSTSLDPSQPGGAYLSAALRVSDNLSGFNSGYIYFRSPSSGQLHSISLSLDNLQGSTLAGTLYASRKLYPAMTAGSWELDSILLGDKAGNSLYKTSLYSSDWNSFLSSSGITQTSFQVVYGSNPAPGTGPDSLAPSIQGFSLVSSSLDPSQPGGAYLSTALRLADNLSGFDSGSIRFRSASSSQTQTLYFGKSSFQGSTLAGTVYASQKLDPTTAAGSWSLDSISLSDNAGNSVFKNSYSPDWNTFLSSSGITQTAFQVVYGTNPAPAPGIDSLAPTLQSFTLDSSILDPSQPGGAFLVARIGFSDNISGVNSGYLGFSSDSGNSFNLYFGYASTGKIISGTALSGIALTSAQLRPNEEAGTWRLTRIYLRDNNDNELEKSSEDSDWNTFLSASGITQPSYQVAYGPNLPPGIGPDSLAPSIQSFALDSSTLDPSRAGGAFLSGILSFSDNLSGFSSATLEYVSDSGQSKSLDFVSTNIISGTKLSGTVFASSQLKANAPAGTWRLTSVSLSDDAHNYLSKNSSSSDWSTFLSSSGITQTSFQVVYGPNPAPGTGPDSLAPTIQSFTLDTSSLDPSQPGGAFLSGRLSFKDNVSGFDKGSLRFSSDSGQTTGLDFGYWKQINIISGSELSGVAFASSQLAATAAAGTWRLTSIYLSDKANNSFSISSSSSDWATFLSSSGITQTSFEVVYGGAPTPPLISLAVSPASVTEDGTANLVYTFTRTGPTTNSLTVNYSIAGTADASDYSAATPGIAKAITFAAGLATATLVIDPIADSTVEPDETVVLALQSGGNYTIGPAASATGTIRNVDAPAPLYTTLTTIRSLVFQKAVANNHYSVSIDGLVKPITIQGNPVYEGIYSGWLTLAAATVDGANTVLWLNPAANRLHTWTTDANWSWLSSQGWIDPNSDEGYRLESQFNLDLNKDLIVGTPYSTIATVGSVVFQKAIASNRYSVSIDGLVKPITIQGNPVYEGIYSGWQTLAAATVDGTNTVLWLNPAANRLHTWTTDANWSWLSSQGWIDPNSDEGYRLESQFNLDLNKDLIVGTPYSTIATVGSVVFQKAIASNRYSVSIDGLVKPITIQGNPVYEGIYSGWQTLAAATVDGTNTVLWLNPAANRLHTWTTDANWSWLSSQGWIDPNSDEGYTLESNFSIDLNHDSIIGIPLPTLEYLVSRIVMADPVANAAKGFWNPLAGTSGADNIVATSSNQLLTGYDLVTGIAGVATQAGQIDVLDGAFAYAKTFLVAGYTRQPYANDGDQGFTLIKNFRLGSDDLVLDKAQPYVFASRSVQAYGDTVSGLGVHLDSNRNGSFDASDNLIALLAYGTANSAAGGNMAYGTSAFTGRLILI
jgi:hypothetical protein